MADVKQNTSVSCIKCKWSKYPNKKINLSNWIKSTQNPIIYCLEETHIKIKRRKD